MTKLRGNGAVRNGAGAAGCCPGAVSRVPHPMILHCRKTGCSSTFRDDDASCTFALRVRAMKQGWQWLYPWDVCPKHKEEI